MASDEIIDDILKLVASKDKISTLDIAEILQIDHQQAFGAINSIVSQAAFTTNKFLKTTKKEYKQLELTQEGFMIKENGSHEARLVKKLLEIGSSAGIDQQSLLKTIPDALVAKVGFSKAMSNGWISLDKETKLVKSNVDKIDDPVQDMMKRIEALKFGDEINLESKIINELKKRKLIVENVIKFLVIEKGEDFKQTIEKPETDLTAELLQSGDWRTKKFKEYNFNSLGVVSDKGYLHPLLKVREHFRQIFIEMGFSEMATNNFVENSFWNFDALVVPQAHPARDSQDTFFIRQPEKSSVIKDRNLVTRTRQAHEGSKDGVWPRGYQYNWSEKESLRNVLRTHTTAVTTRVLYKIAQEYSKTGVIKPAKFFSIDRVFRNETLDATHLAEFNQVEGVVLDKNLTLGDLMGVLGSFFEKLGVEKLRFKPAYNPYTEPSMEIFSYHEGLKKWVEVGNSGLFRPEMLQALGLPEDMTAIAWGLSLERPTMIRYKIDNIRELVGPKGLIKV